MTDFYSQNRCVCSTRSHGHCYVHFAFIFTLISMTMYELSQLAVCLLFVILYDLYD